MEVGENDNVYFVCVNVCDDFKEFIFTYGGSISLYVTALMGLSILILGI